MATVTAVGFVLQFVSLALMWRLHTVSQAPKGLGPHRQETTSSDAQP